MGGCPYGDVAVRNKLDGREATFESRMGVNANLCVFGMM